MRSKNISYQLNRKFRDTIKALLEETRVMNFIDAFKHGLWSEGKLKPPSVRTVDEKERTRDEANRKLSALMPGMSLTTSSHTCVDNSHCRFGCKHDGKVKRSEGRA